MPAITRSPNRRTPPILRPSCPGWPASIAAQSTPTETYRNHGPIRVSGFRLNHGGADTNRLGVELCHTPVAAAGPRPGRSCRRSAKLFAKSLFRAIAGIRHRGAPELHTGPPAGSRWPIGRHPMPEPRPNQAASQTSRTTTQFDHRSPHIATRASTANFVLVKPWRCADYGRIVHPAETTTLRKLRCPVTRRGFDVA
jgi:hypothetical protein